MEKEEGRKEGKERWIGKEGKWRKKRRKELKKGEVDREGRLEGRTLPEG